MAQPKQTKKKRRPRSDPTRKAAAVRREEARRQAAEERQRAEEAVERRKKILKTARRIAMPTVIGIGVVVAAIFLFHPMREIPGAEMIASPTIVTDLGYELPDPIDTGALPVPSCGVVEQPVSSGELFLSDLYNGAVVLWYRAGDQETATALAELAGEFDSHVVVSPSPNVTDGVLATSWQRRKAYDSVDVELREFVDAYRLRAPKHAACDLPT